MGAQWVGRAASCEADRHPYNKRGSPQSKSDHVQVEDKKVAQQEIPQILPGEHYLCWVPREEENFVSREGMGAPSRKGRRNLRSIEETRVQLADSQAPGVGMKGQGPFVCAGGSLYFLFGMHYAIFSMCHFPFTRKW